MEFFAEIQKLSPTSLQSFAFRTREITTFDLTNLTRDLQQILLVIQSVISLRSDSVTMSVLKGGTAK